MQRNTYHQRLSEGAFARMRAERKARERKEAMYLAIIGSCLVILLAVSASL